MERIVTQENIDLIDFLEGAIVLVDKPEEWTSFDVVNKLRGALRRKYNIRKIKVGHAGTLDPIATGLLVICTGKWTPKLNELQGLDKDYSGEMILGEITASYDRETNPVRFGPWEHLTRDALENATQYLTGPIEQMPPMFSAIKVKGQPLYKAARKGEEVERKARNVTIRSFDIQEVELPKVSFSVSCSTGTYIRSLVHDLGQSLQCGAYLNALRRTRIGEYNVDEAWSVEELTARLSQ